MDKRLTGSDAKARRGNGWGGKGSSHPTADGRYYGKTRRYVPYRSKTGRGGKAWQIAQGQPKSRPPRIAAE